MDLDQIRDIVAERRPRIPAFCGRVFWDGPFRGPLPPGLAKTAVGAAFGQMARLAAVQETDLFASGAAITGLFGRLTRDILDKTSDGCAARMIAGMDQNGDFPAHLNGDFALAGWDGPARTLMLASDHFATRPLYYMRLPDGAAFSSEVEWLRPFSAHAEGDFHLPCLQGHLGQRYWRFADRTMIPDIYKVPPGTRIKLCRDRCDQQRYWRPEDAPRQKVTSPLAAVEQARMLLHQAVVDRIPATGQYDAHLSAGLDSTVIAAILAREAHRRNTRPPDGLCWHPRAQPDRPAAPEQQIFQLCLDTFRINGMSSYDRGLELQPLAWTLDPVTIPVVTLGSERAVMEQAQARGTALIFSGHGGDEAVSFSGVHWHHAHVPCGVIDTYRRLRGRADARPAHGLLRRQFAVEDLGPDAPFWQFYTPRSRQTFALRHGHLAYRMAGWSQLGACYGVQYCYPLLDRRLVEFTLGLPWRFYDRAKGNRALMREIVRPWVPEIVATRHDKSEPSFAEDMSEMAIRAVAPFRGAVASIDPIGSRATWIDQDRLSLFVDQIAGGNWRGIAWVTAALGFLVNRSASA